MLTEVSATDDEDTSKTTVDAVLEEIERFEDIPTDRPEPGEPAEPEREWVDRELAYAKLLAFQSHHESKKKWSNFMIFAMTALILFQMLLLGMVGFGWWDFTAYNWLLPILLVQNFAQIVGLAIVIVKALFGSFKE